MGQQAILARDVLLATAYPADEEGMDRSEYWVAGDPALPGEPRLRYHLARGMVGVESRWTLARVLWGMTLWLTVPPLAARWLGRLGWHAALTALQRWWARRLQRHLEIQLDSAGLEHIVPGTTYVVAPLHEGFADALPLFQLPLRLCFTARDELFGWRLLGPVLGDTGQILVAPERGTWSYRRLVRAARAVTERGTSVVVFPQGTILGLESDFQIGAFALAKTLDLPLLPIMLTGGHRVWEHPYTPRLRYGQRMSLRVLPPLDVATVRETIADALRDRVQRQLKAAALAPGVADPRRFVPARDGYWDGFRYRIDPAFPELAADVARHRAQVAGTRSAS